MQPSSSNRGRNAGLDLVRAVAIGLVLVGHGTLLFPQLPRIWSTTVLYVGGYFGVELFFVLSGFLIGGLLLRLFERHGFRPHARDILAFWQRRWWRTLPNYYLFLLLNLTLFGDWFGPPAWQWGHFLFMQNLAWPPGAVMPESWSLAVEEWSYLLLPVVLWLGVRCLGARPRALLIALLTILALALVARFGVVWAFDPTWDAGVRKVVALRLDAVAWGALMAYLMHYHAAFMIAQWRVGLVLGAALTLGNLAWLLAGVGQGFETLGHKTLLFSTTGIGLALLLPASYVYRPPSVWLQAGVRHLSLVSYSVYLVHFSLVIPLLSATGLAQRLPMPMTAALYLALAIGIATFVYTVFERPMTALRDRQGR
ncbi:acyltransferase family protein [Chromohalobacter japonicus]|uniref:acyltransferase family protein n=1 Tax=Chromohalobacter japonicus TaxID=223900 RepID=UPI001FF60438|nr:acyltransferase [Chromohalobacter japonicus]MCK0751807.1 acyltransferase [Chromohalobacter japonicus]